MRVARLRGPRGTALTGCAKMSRETSSDDRRCQAQARPILTSSISEEPGELRALTPLGFIERAAYVYPNRTAVIHGARRSTWAETYARCRRLASALATPGDGRRRHRGGDAREHAGNARVPLRRSDGGRGLNTLNTRLDPEAIAFMLEHGGAKVLIADREFSGTVARALATLKEKPFVIDVDDPDTRVRASVSVGRSTSALIAQGDPELCMEAAR